MLAFTTVTNFRYLF